MKMSFESAKNHQTQGDENEQWFPNFDVADPSHEQVGHRIGPSFVDKDEKAFGPPVLLFSIADGFLIYHQFRDGYNGNREMPTKNNRAAHIFLPTNAGMVVISR